MDKISELAQELLLEINSKDEVSYREHDLAWAISVFLFGCQAPIVTCEAPRRIRLRWSGAKEENCNPWRQSPYLLPDPGRLVEIEMANGIRQVSAWQADIGNHFGYFAGADKRILLPCVARWRYLEMMPS